VRPKVDRGARVPNFSQVEQGLKLYNQHKQQAAVAKWKSALKRIRKREDKFLLLGYLYQAYMDWGKFRYVYSPRAARFGHPIKYSNAPAAHLKSFG